MAGANKTWELMYREWKELGGHLLTHEDRQRLVRGCRGKLSFPDFGRAMLTANRMIRNGDVKAGGCLCLYSCEICGGTHIGNRKAWGIEKQNRVQRGSS